MLVCQNRMGSTVGSSEELDFLTMLILSLWSFITFESQLLTSWSIFCSLDTQVLIFLGCPATRKFLRIHWDLFVHKEEKYIVFLICKVWNEENNRFYNSATLCSFRYKRSSSLLLFLSYSIPIPSLLLTKKQHYSTFFFLFPFVNFFLSSKGWLIFLSFFFQCFREAISAGSVQGCNPLSFSCSVTYNLLVYTHRLKNCQIPPLPKQSLRICQVLLALPSSMPESRKGFHKT